MDDRQIETKGVGMLLTITLILVAIIATAAFEMWLFWQLGERQARRRNREHPGTESS
jgi:hypothetical protein